MDELSERMKEMGMIPLPELLSKDPMGAFAAHVGVGDIQSFEEWVSMRHKSFLRMRLEYETGMREKDDMYEWVFAHAATFGEVAANLRQALGKPV